MRKTLVLIRFISLKIDLILQITAMQYIIKPA